MKHLLAMTLIGAAFAAQATTPVFSDAEVEIVLLPEAPATRNGQYVTFAAESTFKVAADARLPAGTKMKLIWTVNCVKKEQRIVLAAIAVPGQVPLIVSREEMVAIAKKEPFVSPKDTISKQVMASMCR